METFLRRNFKVEGNIASIYKPGDSAQVKLIEGIEVQLWHKAPMEKIFLASGFTNPEGNFSIEFEVNSPVDYIVDGTISDVFLEAYYHGMKLESDEPALLTGLAAYWKFDETSGTTAADATSNNHSGTLSGATPPTWDAGKINNGLTFYGGSGGITDSYLSVPSSTDFDFGNGDFTYAFWLKSSNLTDYITLFDSGYPSTGSFYLGLVIPDQIRVHIEDVEVYIKTTSLAADTWYHLVVRRINDQLEIFKNGLSLGSETFSGVIGCPGDLTIGKYSGGGQNFDGMLDELAIWKGRGLTDLEIETLYNSGNGLQYPFQ